MNGTYIDQMAEYSTLHQKSVNGRRSTKQVIGRGTYFGQVVLKPHNSSKQLTDDDEARIGALVKRAVSSRAV